MSERPDQTGGSEAMQPCGSPTTAQGVTIALDRDAPAEVLSQVATAIASPQVNPIAAMEAFIARRQVAMSPSERGVPFIVPQLGLERDD